MSSSATRSLFRRFGYAMLACACLSALLLCNSILAANDNSLQPAAFSAPFSVQNIDEQSGVVTARLNQSDFFDLRMGSAHRTIAVPLNAVESIQLDLQRFNAATANTRFVIGSAGGNIETSRPDVVCFRGSVDGQTNSHAFLAVSADGMASGYIRSESGETYYVSQDPAEAAKGWSGAITIHQSAGSIELPDGVAVCGVEPPANFTPFRRMNPNFDDSHGMRMAHIAIDSDQPYYKIFNNVSAAQGYVVIVMAAVSDIYMRDFNMKMLLDYVRIWPTGGEPFAANDLSGFRFHWESSENPAPYNYVHMFSGRRDLSYGGVAFVGGTCSGSATYGISGFLNGTFPTPFNAPSNSNWDVIVVAHEMGHNSGTYHTHDGYTPTIDDCGNGTPSRGTIMSYCHSFAGYTANTDLWMHSIVEQVVEEEFATLNCYDFDCNGNDIPDNIDITSGSSIDSNSDGIPDECQDCNSNSILDPVEIAGGAQDVDDNGILDVCETDCNNNNIPDHYEIAIGSVPDADGNNIPDACDVDCNNNNQNDWVDTESGVSDDFDRNAVPDECQDCNNNGRPDWIDLGRQYNLFVADQLQRVREFHQASGYPIRDIFVGGGSSPTDAVFNSANKLLVSDAVASRIFRVDVDSATVSTLVTIGLGGLNAPTFMLIHPSNDNLIVSSRGSNSVLQYNSLTGAFIGTLIPGGSGGLSQPYGIAIGPGNTFYVASGGTNSILRYDASGGFMNVFVSSGSGGLSQPRGIAFLPNGNLLVASYGTDQILQYNGTTGAFIGVFNDLQAPSDPFGIKIGPNGNVFVSENALSGSTPRIIEYLPIGRFFRRYVRGDNSGLVNPTGFAFRKGSPLDCNRNNRLDVCDIARFYSVDMNLNGTPDECETPDSDGDGIVNGLDNCPNIANAAQQDLDFDKIGDVCDNCPTVPNTNQSDVDMDGVGDFCDNCKWDSNPGQENLDGDLLGDACETCDSQGGDDDNDGLCAAWDNCPNVANANQADADGDNIGDVCDACPLDALNDGDSDGLCANFDNCPTRYNPDQNDADADLVGDSCDNCMLISNPGQEDSNNNGIGDVCDSVCGDVDDNNLVTISDVVFLINYIFGGGPAPNPLNSGDVDCNSLVTISDAVYLINFIFGGGPAPCSQCP